MVTEASAAEAVRELDTAARQLRVLGEELVDAAAAVRALVALVQWEAKAATAFHERAESWAEEVRGVDRILDAARADALSGRARAAFEADLSRLRG